MKGEKPYVGWIDRCDVETDASPVLLIEIPGSSLGESFARVVLVPPGGVLSFLFDRLGAGDVPVALRFSSS